MFDIGWGELVVIGIVALIAIGPKELPGVLRNLGHWVGKIRRMAGEFQSQFQEAMREAEIVEMTKQFDEANKAASNFTSGIENPLETVQKELQSAVEAKPEGAAATAEPKIDLPMPEMPAPVTSADILPAPKSDEAAASAPAPAEPAPHDAPKKESGAA